MLEEYGINGNRNTIRDDVKALNDGGHEILSNVGPSNSKLYYYGKRTFDNAERKLLVDAVSASQFIGVKKSDELIDKICKLTSTHEAENIKKRVYTAERIKTENSKLLYIVNTINAAIEDKKKNNKVVTFRIDRMCMSHVLEESAIPMPEGFSVPEYINKSFKIFDRELQQVVLECPNHLMKKMIDKFGEDFDVERVSEDRFQATVSVNVSKTFFGWVYTYAGEINLVGPEDVVKAYRKYLRKSLK